MLGMVEYSFPILILQKITKSIDYYQTYDIINEECQAGKHNKR